MVETKRKLTPEEKVEKGLSLNDYERTQFDAHRLTLRRIRDNESEQEMKAEMAKVPKSADVKAKTGN